MNLERCANYCFIGSVADTDTNKDEVCIDRLDCYLFNTADYVYQSSRDSECCSSLKSQLVTRVTTKTMTMT